MKEIFICDENIKLGQALKLAGLVSSGVEAKFFITDGQVLVNGHPEYQRGKKIIPGDILTFQEEEVCVRQKI